MTVARGRPWGAQVPRPDHIAVARSDAELASFVALDRQAAVGVAGGDVFAALGSPAARGATARRLPMDLLHLRLDDLEVVAVAHVVVRHRWWRGGVTAVMNVGRLGRWDVAPAGHPNDGRVEVIDVDRSMSLRTRLQVRRRLTTGAHVPHPQIQISHRTDGALRFDRRRGVWVDGVRRGTVGVLSYRVEPDAYALIC